MPGVKKQGAILMPANKSILRPAPLFVPSIKISIDIDREKIFLIKFSKGSVHVHTAVDVDGLAGHKIAVVGGEEDHGANEIGGILFPLKRAALAPVGESLGGHGALSGNR